MINTVSGQISDKNLGVTLMHEHIMFDMNGAMSNTEKKYDASVVLNAIVPYLIELKECGCDTLVDATTYGTGRDVEVLKMCSKLSGLNIITNSGLWDSAGPEFKTVPDEIKDKSVDEIASVWVDEYTNGIHGSCCKPGYIKLAICGDSASKFHEVILRAACRTSIKTGQLIECHMCSIPLMEHAVRIIEDEGLRLDRFVWVHADFCGDLPKIIEMAGKGIWVEIDYIARAENLNWQVDALLALKKEGLLGRALISQDAGAYRVGKMNDNSSIFPYTRIFKEFIPLCDERGLGREDIDLLLVSNPLRALSGGL